MSVGQDFGWARIASIVCSVLAAGGIVWLIALYGLGGGEAARVAEEPEPVVVEPVQTDLRKVGGQEFAAVELPGETVERLPSRLPPPVKLPPKEVEHDPVALLRPRVEHPGELRSGGYTVQLAGTISPPLDLLCPAGDELLPCGRMARTALRNFLRARTALCGIPPVDPPLATRARCSVGGSDIGRWLVLNGWAVTQRGSSLEQAMTVARSNKRGLWELGDAVDMMTQVSSEQTEAATNGASE